MLASTSATVPFCCVLALALAPIYRYWLIRLFITFCSFQVGRIRPGRKWARTRWVMCGWSLSAYISCVLRFVWRILALLVPALCCTTGRIHDWIRACRTGAMATHITRCVFVRQAACKGSVQDGLMHLRPKCQPVGTLVPTEPWSCWSSSHCAAPMTSLAWPPFICFLRLNGFWLEIRLPGYVQSDLKGSSVHDCCELI